MCHVLPIACEYSYQHGTFNILGGLFYKSSARQYYNTETE
jgi:hypothetical protein